MGCSTQSGASGGFDWGNPFGGGSRGSGASSRSSGGAGGQKQRQQSDEPFYGFGAFFDDLEKEWKERRQRRQKEPQSLWEELADIGEEFVEVGCRRRFCAISLVRLLRLSEPLHGSPPCDCWPRLGVSGNT